MSSKKVAFMSTYKSKRADPPPKERDVFQQKRPMKRPPARWLALTTQTCRDFSKNSFDYRDYNFSLSDQGRVFNYSACENRLKPDDNKFSKTEFRFLDVKPGLQNEDNRKVFQEYTYTSKSRYTLCEDVTPVGYKIKRVQIPSQVQQPPINSQKENIRRPQSASQQKQKKVSFEEEVVESQPQKKVYSTNTESKRFTTTYGEMFGK